MRNSEKKRRFNRPFSCLMPADRQRLDLWLCKAGVSDHIGFFLANTRFALLCAERCKRVRPIVISCGDQQADSFRAGYVYGALKVHQHAFRLAICGIGSAA